MPHTRGLRVLCCGHIGGFCVSCHYECCLEKMILADGCKWIHRLKTAFNISMVTSLYIHNQQQVHRGIEHTHEPPRQRLHICFAVGDECYCKYCGGRLCLLVHMEKTLKRPAKSTGQTSPSAKISPCSQPPNILLQINSKTAARNCG